MLFLLLQAFHMKLVVCSVSSGTVEAVAVLSKTSMASMLALCDGEMM
jgi:hypothetical protein